MPPRMQTRNACGIFENTTTVFRLGVDEFGDLPLPDQGR